MGPSVRDDLEAQAVVLNYMAEAKVWGFSIDDLDRRGAEVTIFVKPSMHTLMVLYPWEGGNSKIKFMEKKR